MLKSDNSNKLLAQRAFDMSPKSVEWLEAKVNQPLKESINRSNLLKPFFNYSEIFYISRKYDLATCLVRKVMGTFRSGMFCYLNRQREFEKAGRSISTEHWSNTLCSDGRDKKNTFREASELLSKHPVIFSVVRDPIDRFLSGYVNKCVQEKLTKEEVKCFGCRGDLQCFFEQLRKNLIASYEKNNNLTEREMFYTQHFAPATWYCNLRESISHMRFIQYEQHYRWKLAADFDDVLRSAGVPSKQRNYIRQEVYQELPVHSTARNRKRKDIERALLDPKITVLFAEIYYYDYVVFDFKFPLIKL